MKWVKIAAIMMAALSSNIYAGDHLREEANQRVKNAVMFKPGDIVELNKGKHFVVCSTKEDLLKVLDYAAKQDTAKMASMLNNDQCIALNSSLGKYRVLSVDPQMPDVMRVISTNNNAGSDGAWTTSFFDFKK